VEIHVIRHTPVAYDKKKCYGQIDVPLAESFLADAKKIKAFLPADFSRVYTSPRVRCTSLVNELGLTNVHTDGRLQELSFGEWEGKLWNDIPQEELNQWMADFVELKPPGGESLNEMYWRVESFIDAIRLENFENLLVVTHAGVIRCFWAYVLGMPLINIFKIPVGFNEHFIFKLGDSKTADSILKMN